jgi:ADP-ribose pyrophosphatase YjhB (NUDIX family)
MSQHAFCGYCGVKFAEQVKYPRKCFACYQDTWLNPLPAIATAIRVWKPGAVGYSREWGVLIQKRNIEPKKGEWACIGGYLDIGETWQETTSRETQEEVGLALPPSAFALVDIIPQENKFLLVRSVSVPIVHWEQIKFKPNDEVSEIAIAYKSEKLGFEVHSELMEKVLGG